MRYDGPQPASLEAVLAWYGTAGDVASGAQVRLCVAAPGGAARADAAALERADAWCLDAGFEHVPLADGVAESREPQGLARAREALQSHTWSGLVAKPRPARAPPAPEPAVPLAVPDEAIAAVASAGEAGDPEAAEEDEFEALMGAMLQARDQAAGGAMPDSARRASAAALALRMAALLGEDSDGEDSSGGDE
jgi:hypothetical protein